MHLQIKSRLHEQPANWFNPELMATLADRLLNTRTATLEAERWLAGNYLTRLATEVGATFKGAISHVNSSGFTVRLDDNGLEGFVDLRKDPEKFSYDKWTASLTSTTRRFQLRQTVELMFVTVDESAQYRAMFKLMEGCGLKPPKVAADTAAPAQTGKKPEEPAKVTPDGKTPAS